jgi:hypothetical protein
MKNMLLAHKLEPLDKDQDHDVVENSMEVVNVRDTN